MASSNPKFSVRDSIISGVAGGMAGLTIDLIAFPIDSIKTRLQASGKEVNYVQQAKSVNLYKGFMSVILGAFPGAALFFLGYDTAKAKLAHFSAIPENVRYACAASFGEICATLIRNPVEVIKQQMQIGLHDSFSDSLRGIHQKYGIAGFYKGYLSLVMREIPFACCQLPIYETFKRFSHKHYFTKYGYAPKDSDLSSGVHAKNGSLAGGISGLVTTPIDVIKTKLMTNPEKYVSPRQALQLVLQEEGIGALSKGWHVRFGYLSFGGIFFFGMYERTKAFLYSRLD